MRWRLQSLLFTLTLVAGGPILLGGLLGGCGGPELVELRLYPCGIDDLGDLEPRAVFVELSGFDDQGELVETFEIGFDDISASVFDDGFATVGYRKDPRVVQARVRLGWFASTTATSIADADVIAVYESVDVPALGEALDLRSSACSDVAGDGDGDGDMTGDGDGDMTGDGDGDTTGDGDGDTTGDGDGDMTGDGDGDMTGDGDGDMTGDGDGDMTGDGDGEPEEVPKVGDPCNPLISFQCVPAPDANAGTPLRCSAVSMMLETTNAWVAACAGLCPFGSSNPVNACAGFGHPAQCLCQPFTPEPCVGATLGCTGDDHIKLCHNGGVVIAQCNNCTMTPGGYYSCSR